MAEGQGSYQPGYGQEQYSQESYDGAAPQEQDPRAAPGGKTKRRAYAGQAFDFGSGANSSLASQGAPAQAQPAQSYGGYPAAAQAQQQAYGQPAYGQPSYGEPAPVAAAAAATPAYGQPAYGAAGGYQPPEPAYPGAQAGMSGVTQAFGKMGLGGQQQQPKSPATQQPGPGSLQLNRLQSTDLISAPFHVSELDLPPPPIILPPNVSYL